MKPLRGLILYIVVVFLGGALLAPWLHALINWLATSWPAFKSLAAHPFHRYLTRSFLLIALIGLWPLIRSFGLGSVKELGFARYPGRWRDLLKGFGLGLISLGLIAVFTLFIGVREWDGGRSTQQIIRHLMNASFAAVVVAILEEVLFRGAIFGSLRKTGSLIMAILVSSGVYALLHFFAPVRAEGPVFWNSGLILLPQMCRGFFDLGSLIPGFINLTLAGMLLAQAFHRSGALYASIGLHAGWIFWLKTYGFFTVAGAGINASIWGTNKLVDGWIACLVLAGLFPVVAFIFKKKTEV